MSCPNCAEAIEMTAVDHGQDAVEQALRAYGNVLADLIRGDGAPPGPVPGRTAWASVGGSGQPSAGPDLIGQCGRGHQHQCRSSRRDCPQ